MADVTKLVLAVDSTQVKKGRKELNNMQGSGLRAAAAIKVLATGFVALKMAQYAKEAALLSARFETLGVVMTVVGNNAGYTGEEMERLAKGLQDSGIAMIESRDNLTRMAQAHMDLSKASKLSRIAQDAAVIGNVNSSEAFSRLIRGIQTAQTEVLRTVGINVSFEQSYKKLGDQLGKNAKDLTEQEKVLARTNAVLDSGIAIAGAYTAAMDTTGKKISSLPRYFNDLKLSIGAAFDPILERAVDSLTDSLKNLDSWFSDEENKTAIKAFGDNTLGIFEAVEVEAIRLNMLLDKVGGTMTFIASLPSAIPAAMGIESSEKRMELWAKRNLMYEERFAAGDKRLQEIADKQYQREIASTPRAIAAAKAKLDAIEATRMATAKALKLEAQQAEATALLKAEADKLTATIQAQLDALKLEADMLGMTTTEAELYKLALAGATEQQLKTAASSLGVVDAFNAQQKASEKAKKALLEEAEAADTIAGILEELNIAILSDSEQQIASINAVADGYKAQVTQLEMIGELTPDVAQSMREVFGQKAQDDIAALGDKTKTFTEMLADGSAEWARGYASSLNDMLWSSESTFDDILASFGKMITEMLIQSALIDLVGTGESDDSGGLVSAGIGLVSSLFTPSAAGGYDIPAGTNPMTQLHEKEMVLPAKHAETIRNMDGKQAPPQVNNKIINVLDKSVLGDYLGTTEGEQVIMNIITKNGK